MDSKMRSSAFAAYGALSPFGVGAQHQAFLEQVITIYSSITIIQLQRSNDMLIFALGFC